MGVISIREFNANVSKALARVAAGESLDISNKGKVFAEIRPKQPGRRDDPAFRASLARLEKLLDQNVPGLTGPASYDERTGR